MQSLWFHGRRRDFFPALYFLYAGGCAVEVAEEWPLIEAVLSVSRPLVSRCCVCLCAPVARPDRLLRCL